MHIALPIGEENVLMASDVLESLGEQLVQGNNIYVSVHPTSRAEAERIFLAPATGEFLAVLKDAAKRRVDSWAHWPGTPRRRAGQSAPDDVRASPFSSSRTAS